MALHAPVLVLKDSLKRESGEKVHQAKAVADIIRTTLGPRTMLKMLVDGGEEVRYLGQGEGGEKMDDQDDKEIGGIKP